MSVIKANGAGEQSTGFYNNVVTKSLRFDSANSAHLTRTPSSAGNTRTFTFSAWFKKTRIYTSIASSQFNPILSAGDGASDFGLLSFSGQAQGASSDTVNEVIYYDYDAGADYSLELNRSFGDSTSWFHFMFAVDTTDGTQANRIKYYVNGELQTTNTNAHHGAFPQNRETSYNRTDEHMIGKWFNQGGVPTFDGYMAEINFVDGTQLDASSFGETKNGVWIPKKYTGSYGTNGYRLVFDSSDLNVSGGAVSDPRGSGTNLPNNAIADASGSGNHWTISGIAAHDFMIDCPENNFGTLLGTMSEGANEYQSYGTGTYTEGGLKVTAGSGWTNGKNNFLVDSGKWYCECVVNAWHAATHIRIGVYARPARTYDEYFILGDGTGQIDAAARNVVSSFSTGNIIQIALDLENNAIYFGINGTWSNSATASEIAAGTTTNAFASGSQVPTGDGHSYGFYFNCHPNGTNISVNFGQDSSFAGIKTAQGNADSEGFGDFYYTPPTGFLAMCASNLADPAIGSNSDTKPRDVFDVVLYSGNDGTQTVATDFRPDWVWLKSRAGAEAHSHFWLDSSRSDGTIYLKSDTTNVEATDTTVISTLNPAGSTGFTLGNSVVSNDGDTTYVAWLWKINGGTTSTNSDGSANSTVQVNQAAGISIVLYTGNATGAGAEQTIGHGLGAVPDVILFKSRDYDSQNWYMHHTGLVDGVGTHIELDTNAGEHADGDYMNGVAPTSSVFSLGYNFTTNKNGNAYIAYCFKSIAGYSKFGFYEGNSNAAGAYVHLGFRPRWVMIKNTDDTDNWYISDEVRDTADAQGNPMTETLNANNGNLEYTTGSNKIDFLANGFRCRDSASGDTNINNEIYIYWAFAEAPFKYANAK